MQNHQHQLARTLLIGLGLAICLLLAACPLSLVALQRRVIPPPTFAVQIGRVEIAAPCPTRVFDCPQPMPWYAIWQSEEYPDGRIQFRQLFFLYLEPTRHQ
jgi:hypothetical protein